MTAIPDSPPVILPLSKQQNRPKWSVMVPVYNCSHFLQQTLESVLVNNIPEKDMQIEVVDDASTDADVEELVKRIGKGRIKYFRQVQNVGSLKNFETCINRSTGKLVHLLHGDDKVIPGYYRKIESLFEQHPEAGAAFSRYRSIDENGNKINEKSPEMYREGILHNWLLTIGERQRIQYAAITVRREVYEKLGSFYGLVYGEDWEMWVRIARHYKMAYTPEILAEYRVHQKSISGNKILKGDYLQDLFKAMLLIQQHLPEADRDRILKISKKYYAAYGIKLATRLWKLLHNKQAVDANIRHSLNLYKSPKLLLMISILYIKLIFNKA